MASEKNNFVGEGFLECIYVLDSAYETKMIIDEFSDFLWTERYYGYGEFEITVPVNVEIIKNCRIDDYVSIKESNKIMVVETIGLHTDPENGDTLTISGRSLESLLERRIILDEVIGTIDSDGFPNEIDVQTAVKTIINNNIINPADSNRQISNFLFKDSVDSKVCDLLMDSFSERGAYVYDKIVDICKDNGLGFTVDVFNNDFIFELYFGVDRSRDQDLVAPVIFSESYENLNNSDYLQSIKDYKSVAYVEWGWTYDEDVSYTDSDGDTVTITETRTGTEVTKVARQDERIGLDRREIYTREYEQIDIGSISGMQNGAEQIANRGREFLVEYEVTKLFDGEINTYRQFVYGIDYYLGDIVQLENKYGQTGKCRVTEVMFSRDASGPSMVPTFEDVDEQL